MKSNLEKIKNYNKYLLKDFAYLNLFYEQQL